MPGCKASSTRRLNEANLFSGAPAEPALEPLKLNSNAFAGIFGPITDDAVGAKSQKTRTDESYRSDELVRAHNS
jgi:hypothetical protein